MFNEAKVSRMNTIPRVIARTNLCYLCTLKVISICGLLARMDTLANTMLYASCVVG